MVDKYRNYVVRKYVRARNAAEAIELERDLAVCEVNEMDDKPSTQNEQRTLVIGYQYTPTSEFN